MKRILIILLVALSMSSCATIFSGSKASVTLDSEVEGSATVVVEGRRYRNVEFPCKVKISRGFNETAVRVTVDGYASEVVVIKKEFNPIALLNLAEPFGWILDVAAGAVTRPKYDYYWLEFVPKSY